MLSVCIWASAMLALIIVPISYTLALAFFIALGSGLAGFRMSMNNMVFEFGDTAERPMRIAVVNSVAEFSNAVGPLIAGIMADMISYKSVFGLSILCTILALVLMYRRVTEPRQSIRSR
jgi:MFS family permease